MGCYYQRRVCCYFCNFTIIQVPCCYLPIAKKLVVKLKVTVKNAILAITAMVQGRQMLLASVHQDIIAYEALKSQNLTMTPLVEYALEEASARQDNNQKIVLQVPECFACVLMLEPFRLNCNRV